MYYIYVLSYLFIAGFILFNWFHNTKQLPEILNVKASTNAT